MIKSFLSFILIVFGALASYGTSSDSLISMLDTVSSTEGKIDIYLKLSKGEYAKIDNVSNLWMNKAIELAHEENSKLGKFKVCRAKGVKYYDLQMLDSSLLYFHKILDHDLLSSPEDSADVYNLLGVTYELKGTLDSAFHYLNQSASIYGNLNSEHGIIKVLTNLGNCFYEAGNLSEAIATYEKAYSRVKKVENQRNLPAVASNYAMLVYMLEKDTLKFNRIMHEVYSLQSLQKEPVLLITFYQNMAIFYTDIGELSRAEEFYEKVFVIAEQFNLPIESGVYSGIGLTKYSQKNYGIAIENFKKALSIATRKSQYKSVYEYLAETYTALQEVDSASYYWKKYVKIAEELEEEKYQNLKLAAGVNLEMVLKDSKIQLLNEEKKSTALTLKVYLLISLVLLLALAFLISVFRQLSKKKKEQQERHKEEMENKNQNLLNMSLRIHQKNKVFIDLEERLKKQHLSQSEEGVLKELKLTLKQSFRVDKDWEQFELYFNDLYHGFYEVLKTECPELTNNDLRICSLSKMRLTIKEIASLLNLSVDAVKSSRYRVKKKLKLPTEVDLSDYLNSKF